MTSKTVRLNNRETAIIYSAVYTELELYKGWLKRLLEMNAEALTPDKRAEYDTLITSYRERIDTMEKLLKKV